MGQSGTRRDKKNIFVNDILTARHSKPVIMPPRVQLSVRISERVTRVNVEIPFLNYITRDFCLYVYVCIVFS